jgi:phage/plasmid primase-like uncharacterized protein
MSGGRCTICNKTAEKAGEQIFVFEMILKDLGLNGSHAHTSCVLKAKRNKERRDARQGRGRFPSGD